MGFKGELKNWVCVRPSEVSSKSYTSCGVCWWICLASLMNGLRFGFMT